MNTYYSSGFEPGIGLLWGLHIFSALVFFIGLIFLIILAVRSFSIKQLKNYTKWLLIVGGVLSVFTMGALHLSESLEEHHGMPLPMHTINGQATSVAMGHMMVGNGADMSMSAMVTALKGKTGDDFDKAFLSMMIPHHQGAVDMAKLAAQNAKHKEIKTLAAGIIAAQQREIATMQAWQKAWGYTK